MTILIIFLSILAVLFVGALAGLIVILILWNKKKKQGILNESKDNQQYLEISKNLNEALNDINLKISNQIADMQSKIITNTYANINEFKESQNRFNNSLNDGINQKIIQLNDELLKLNKDHNKNTRDLIESNNLSQLNLEKGLKNQIDLQLKDYKDRVEKLNQQIGIVQNINKEIKDISNIFTNTRTRGKIGEISLEIMLKDIFASNQNFIYETQKEFLDKKNNEKRVADFAINVSLDKEDENQKYLIIDSKFPVLDQEIMQNEGDEIDWEKYKKSLCEKIVTYSKQIKKYSLDNTLDYQIIYIPSDRIYYEIVDFKNFFNELYLKNKVIVASPSNILFFIEKTWLIYKQTKILNSVEKVLKYTDKLSKFVDDTLKINAELYKKLRGSIELIEKHNNKSLKIQNELEDGNIKKMFSLVNKSQMKNKEIPDVENFVNNQDDHIEE